MSLFVMILLSQHHVYLKTDTSGKTIQYLTKEPVKTYGKSGGRDDHVRGAPHDHVQVKIEPRDPGNSAFSFDDVSEEHVAKRPCVSTSLGWEIKW